MQCPCSPNLWLVYILVFFTARPLSTIYSLYVYVYILWQYHLGEELRSIYTGNGKNVLQACMYHTRRTLLPHDDEKTETQMQRPVFVGTRKSRRACVRVCKSAFAVALNHALRDLRGGRSGRRYASSDSMEGNREDRSAWTVIFPHGQPVRNNVAKIYYGFVGT